MLPFVFCGFALCACGLFPVGLLWLIVLYLACIVVGILYCLFSLGALGL